jgi:hypothetical protein
VPLPRAKVPTALIVVLPLLLLVAALALAVVARAPGSAGPAGDPAADSRPLALPPVDAPDAAGPSCAALLAALPDRLPADPAPLPRRALAEPAPPGALAWAGPGDGGPGGAGSGGSGPGGGGPGGSGGPVVLRCGLPRPAELTPGAPLLQVDGVVWLDLSQPDRDTFIAVDRPTFVALTVPKGLGSGPVQAVSEAVRRALPAG